MNLAELAGKRVTLRGKAGNAHTGAVLLRDGEPPVYVAGLAGWGAATGLLVEVTGVVAVHTGTGSAERHGLTGEVVQLREADWQLVPDSPAR